MLPITTDFDKLTTKELLDDINYGFKYCDMIVIFYDNEDMDYCFEIQENVIVQNINIEI